MSIETRGDLKGLKEAGRIVRQTLEEMKKWVRSGITTEKIDEVGAKVLEGNGARSAPKLVYGFPAAICISVNDEIVHGVPSSRIVRPGDLVKLDVVAEKDGYMADAALTVAVHPVSREKKRLVECAEQAFAMAMRAARAGNRIYDIGRAVEREVKRNGFSVLKMLCGHGVGRSIHEEPDVPNFFDARLDQVLTEGLVIAVEPLLASGSGGVVQAADGWTIKTADGSLAAHYEQTLVITRGDPILLTAA